MQLSESKVWKETCSKLQEIEQAQRYVGSLHSVVAVGQKYVLTISSQQPYQQQPISAVNGAIGIAGASQASGGFILVQADFPGALIDALAQEYVEANVYYTLIGSGAARDFSATADLDSIRAEFKSLTLEWKADTAILSSVQDISLHPAYQRIIGLGKSVLPLIFESLEREPDHWFWALRALTGEDPVPTKDRGKLGAMTDAWLAWGVEHGYVQRVRAIP